jgi:hypothetical protein
MLRALAEELLRRQLPVSWWGNVRFEKTFTPELAQLLADSGCIAISGGLEVASDRLLALMKKGVSVEQVARVTKGFADAGVLVHAYLMYGFPTQTLQDTIDALEYVRQLFDNGCIHSGFFHRFACTVHSPVGQHPEDYGITLLPLPEGSFAKNDVGFIDPTGTDHDALGRGLKKAIYNYMHGIGLDEDVRAWFDHLPGKLPRPRWAASASPRPFSPWAEGAPPAGHRGSGAPHALALPQHEQIEPSTFSRAQGVLRRNFRLDLTLGSKAKQRRGCAHRGPPSRTPRSGPSRWLPASGRAKGCAAVPAVVRMHPSCGDCRRPSRRARGNCGRPGTEAQPWRRSVPADILGAGAQAHAQAVARHLAGRTSCRPPMEGYRRFCRQCLECYPALNGEISIPTMTWLTMHRNLSIMTGC